MRNPHNTIGKYLGPYVKESPLNIEQPQEEGESTAHEVVRLLSIQPAVYPFRGLV